MDFQVSLDIPFARAVYALPHSNRELEYVVASRHAPRCHKLSDLFLDYLLTV